MTEPEDLVRAELARLRERLRTCRFDEMDAVLEECVAYYRAHPYKSINSIADVAPLRLRIRLGQIGQVGALLSVTLPASRLTESELCEQLIWFIGLTSSQGVVADLFTPVTIGLALAYMVDDEHIKWRVACHFLMMLIRLADNPFMILPKYVRWMVAVVHSAWSLHGFSFRALFKAPFMFLLFYVFDKGIRTSLAESSGSTHVIFDALDRAPRVMALMNSAVDTLYDWFADHFSPVKLPPETEVPQAVACPICGELPWPDAVMIGRSVLCRPECVRWVNEHGTDPTSGARATLRDIREIPLVSEGIARWRSMFLERLRLRPSVTVDSGGFEVGSSSSLDSQSEALRKGTKPQSRLGRLASTLLAGMRRFFGIGR